MQSETISNSNPKRLDELETPPRDDDRVAVTAIATERNNQADRYLHTSSCGDITIANVDPHAVDVLLATELKQLSCVDREAVHEEIHGVRTLAPTETPAMIDEALKRMDEIITTKIPTKPAFDHATAMQSRYVLDRGFRLKFIRANLFDIDKAAWNFTRYLELLNTYYGPETLTRPLLYSDLTEAELDLLRSGHMQLLPTRDRTGRRVLNVFGLYKKEHTVESRIRLALYIFSLASDDEETRHLGLVLIVAPTSEQQSVRDPEEHFEVAKICQTMPLRLAAIHICLPNENPVFQLLRATLVLLFARDQMIRIKVHTGSKTECRYQLLTYGIPVEDLANNDNVLVDMKRLGEWIQTRKALDEVLKKNMTMNGTYSLEGSGIVECPRPKDILFSRGGNSWSHAGNIKFRTLLELKRKDHSEARTNDQKAMMITNIVELLEGDHFRFLTWDKPNGWWVQIMEPSSIRSKVAIAMRDHTKRVTRRAKQQLTKSDTC